MLHYNILRSLHKIQTCQDLVLSVSSRKLTIVQSIHSTVELQWAWKEYWFMVNCYDVICLNTNIFMFHNNAKLLLIFFNFLNICLWNILFPHQARYLFAFLKIIKSAGNENLFLKTWKSDLPLINVKIKWWTIFSFSHDTLDIGYDKSVDVKASTLMAS